MNEIVITLFGIGIVGIILYEALPIELKAKILGTTVEALEKRKEKKQTNSQPKVKNPFA